MACDAVAIDQFQPVTLADHLVEGRLVLPGCQAVAGLPRRYTGELAEDRGVAILYTIAVAADHDRLVAFAHELIEGGLVLRGCESMAGLPCGGAWGLAPDRSVEILSTVKVTAHPIQDVAFARELVERGLILRGSESMTSDPGTRRAFLEGAGEAGAGGGGIAVHEHRVIALLGELIERGLIIGSS